MVHTHLVKRILNKFLETLVIHFKFRAMSAQDRRIPRQSDYTKEYTNVSEWNNKTFGKYYQ